MFTARRPSSDLENTNRNLILFIRERGVRNSVSLGCGAGYSVDATCSGDARELRNLYFENNRWNNGNHISRNGRNNGVTGKLSTNGRPAETLKCARNAMNCFGGMLALKAGIL